ncbi:PREDICTED: ferritin, heavy subunit-like [Vollenhovia emeryi]|uniref:ferritin, heavy subunit-like n=1 Tax=Vollenhovia emeryi TaxID=411798 RepID=UPI0005F4D32F|nr:PREDICTED: ferritin, heavy subunit-like [Vollenhovia emeryi]
MLRVLIRKPYYKLLTSHNHTVYSQTRCLGYTSSTRKNSGSDDCGRADACIDKPIKWPSGKRTNFDFHEETEAAMNEQINVELMAFYYYLSMAAHFGRVDVALPGCESFFMQMHHEEHEHASKFLNYIQMRGGKVHLCAISPPDNQDWKCPLHAFKTALQLEIEVGRKLVAVNTVAEKHGDLNASDFIITGFMEDQMRSVNELGKLTTVLSGVGDQALARFMFDKDLLENYVKPGFNVLKNKSQQRTIDK